MVRTQDRKTSRFIQRLFLPALRFKALYAELLGAARGSREIVFLLAGLVLGWWVYVPIHELFHAAGCALTGGDVERLEISRLYGGDLLARIFEFVVPGGDYAGRLSGFETHGSDVTYWVTVFFPYILSIPGYYALERSVPSRRFFVFGAWLPCTLAPLVSLTGDYYELGSLSLYQLWGGPGGGYRALISDDLFLLISRIHDGVDGLGAMPGTMAFVALAFATGLAMAWGTLLMSAWLGHKYGAAPGSAPMAGRTPGSRTTRSSVGARSETP